MKLFVATLLIMAVISADAASLKVILISSRGELNVLLLEGKDILTVIIITTTSIIMINIDIITIITIIIIMLITTIQGEVKEGSDVLAVRGSASSTPLHSRQVGACQGRPRCRSRSM